MGDIDVRAMIHQKETLCNRKKGGAAPSIDKREGEQV
jgi:hypothetical protein